MLFIKFAETMVSFPLVDIHRGLQKKGKIWKTLGYLKRHLKEMGFDRARYSYANCQIIEYVESHPIPIHTIINEAQERSEELSRRREERRERQRIERLEREFELKKRRA